MKLKSFTQLIIGMVLGMLAFAIYAGPVYAATFTVTQVSTNLYQFPAGTTGDGTYTWIACPTADIPSGINTVNTFSSAGSYYTSNNSGGTQVVAGTYTIFGVLTDGWGLSQPKTWFHPGGFSGSDTSVSNAPTYGTYCGPTVPGADTEAELIAELSVPPGPVLNFTYPPATSTPITAFDSFMLNSTTTTSTDKYIVYVWLYNADTNQSSLSSHSNSATGDILQNQGVLVDAEPLDYRWSKPIGTKINLFGLNLNTYHFTATAELVDTTMNLTYNGTAGPIVATSSVSYQLIPLLQNGTSTHIYLPPYSTSTPPIANGTSSPNTPVGNLPPPLISTSTCPEPGSFTDIGGGIAYAGCVVINELFVPSSESTDYLQSSILSFQKVFPFSLVYGAIGDISTAATNAASTTPADLRLNYWGMSVPVLTSTTLSGFIGSSNTSLVFSAEDALAWVAVGWWAIKIIF